MLDRLFYAGLCDFVELDALYLVLRYSENVCKVPGYCLSFAVRVGCEENGIRAFCFGFKLFYKIAFASDIYIFGCKIVFYVYSESAFRKISYVSF